MIFIIEILEKLNRNWDKYKILKHMYVIKRCKMKKSLIIVGILIFLFSSNVVVGIQTCRPLNESPVHRGTFQSELGFRNQTDGVIVLDGTFRDFRGRHFISGSVTHIDSDRSTRFQGFISRHSFIIQAAVRSNIVNIVGRFSSFDEETQEYQGVWSGIVAGVGRTRGWITASFT